MQIYKFYYIIQLYNIIIFINSINQFPFCTFLRFIYETERSNGIAELLEVLGRYASKRLSCYYSRHTETKYTYAYN